MVLKDCYSVKYSGKTEPIDLIYLE